MEGPKTAPRTGLLIPGESEGPRALYQLFDLESNGLWASRYYTARHACLHNYQHDCEVYSFAVYDTTATIAA